MYPLYASLPYSIRKIFRKGWNVYTGSKKLVSDCLIVIKEPTSATIKELEVHSENGRLNIPLRGVSTPYITIEDIKRVLIKNDK